MKICAIYIFLSIITIHIATAQEKIAISGTVADTASRDRLEDASITLINALDSILVAYTWSDKSGHFSLGSISQGRFILITSYPGYADFIREVAVTPASAEFNLGIIPMNLKSRILQEVIVRGYTEIKIKGDTTEFAASNYILQPNDRVEDLLRKLPGIQINLNGTISANGRTINKVYVDGEEFFGDDPLLVTRNIRGDMVDRVQLFTKKSDQAVLTGVEDGKTEKALNIVLKADKRQGYFGKIDVGGATNGYYQAQGMYNYFLNKQKLSAYITVGNTNRTGLNRQENNRYGVNIISEFVNTGDLLESFSGRYTGEGLPDARSAGVHYDTKWDADKESINLNYKIGTIDVLLNKLTTMNNVLQNSTLTSSGSLNSTNEFFRHKADFIYQNKLSPSTDLKISAEGSSSMSETDVQYNAISFNETRMLNTQDRNVANKVGREGGSIATFLTKRFKKPGTSASFTLNFAHSSEEWDGFLSANNRFFSASSLDSVIIVDQYKPTAITSNNFKTGLTFSAPLVTGLTLASEYNFSHAAGELDVRSFNQSSAGSYDLLVQSLSSNFTRVLNSNQFGLFLNYIKSKTTINFGSRAIIFDDDFEDLTFNTKRHRSYVNWWPQFRIHHAFTEQKDISFRYLRTTIQPLINQLQPVRNNVDPINIVVGNPSLRPSFDNNFLVLVNAYGLNGSGILFDAAYNIIENPIINDISTNAAGRSVFGFVNLQDKSTHSYNLSLASSWKLEKAKFSFNPTASLTGGITYNFINGQLNTIRSTMYSLSLESYKSVQKKYDVRLAVEPGYQSNRSSLTDLDNTGLTFRSTGMFSVYLPKRMSVGGNYNYYAQAKTAAFDRSFSRMLLNISLTKRFLKSESLSLTASGNDLLNQNRGFVRSVTGTNMFLQNEFNTINRYVMLSLAYDFNKTITAKK